MNNLVTRYAKNTNSYIAQHSKSNQQNNNETGKSAQTIKNSDNDSPSLFSANKSSKNENAVLQNNDVNISKDEQAKLQDMLKNCQKFSSTSGANLHYLKNVIFFPVLGLGRAILSYQANKHGGSTSSYFRDKNIARNVFLCSKYLASKHNLSPQDVKLAYHSLQYKNKFATQKEIYLVDENV